MLQFFLYKYLWLKVDLKKIVMITFSFLFFFFLFFLSFIQFIYSFSFWYKVVGIFSNKLLNQLLASPPNDHFKVCIANVFIAIAPNFIWMNVGEIDNCGNPPTFPIFRPSVDNFARIVIAIFHFPFSNFLSLSHF